MRKIILAAVLAAMASSTALPALDLSVHAGYTSFALGELNRANASLIGYDGNGHAVPVDSGIVAGIDLTGLSPLPWLSLGVRLESMQSNDAETYTNQFGTDYYVSDQVHLSDLLVGAEASAPAAFGLHLGFGAWAGYGYAALQQGYYSADPTYNNILQSGLFMGSLPVAEIESSVGYDLGANLHLKLTGGWRWANAGYLYDDQHQPLTDNGNNWFNNGAYSIPINIDLSGITAQGSISYSF